MATPRFQRIEARGDGACAFNSFVIATFEESMLAQIEVNLALTQKTPDLAFKAFISKASKTLNVNENWRAVKEKMLVLRKQDLKLEAFQQTFAPILRSLAMELAEGDVEHRDRTKQPLKAAFNAWAALDAARRNGWPIYLAGGDDIFVRHPFIVDKFQELLLAQVEDKDRIAALESWWEEEGYQQFLQKMKQDNAWAGDLELFQLARYFNVNLQVQRDEMIYPIYFDCGVVSRDSVSVVDTDSKELIDRGIIDKPRDSRQSRLALLPLDVEEVQARLEKIPNYQQVLEFCQGNEVFKKQVPSAIANAAPCMQQLRARNVIEPAQGKDNAFVFSVHSAVAKQRIEELKAKDSFMAAWKEKYKKLPTVMLENKNEEGHWDALVPAQVTANNSVSSAAGADSASDGSVVKLDLLRKEIKRKIKSGELKHDVDHLKKLTSAAEAADTTKLTDAVLYTFFADGGAEKKVSKVMQVALDDEYAKKLQEEEYEEYIKAEKKL